VGTCKPGHEVYRLPCFSVGAADDKAFESSVLIVPADDVELCTKCSCIRKVLELVWEVSDCPCLYILEGDSGGRHGEGVCNLNERRVVTKVLAGRSEAAEDCA